MREGKSGNPFFLNYPESFVENESSAGVLLAIDNFCLEIDESKVFA